MLPRRSRIEGGKGAGLGRFGFQTLTALLALGFAGFCGNAQTEATGQGLAVVDPLCRPTIRGSGKAPPVSEGTRRMVERLRRLREEAERKPEQNVFLSSFLAARLQRQVDEAKAMGNTPRLLELRPRLARQLLNAGDTEAALAQYEAFREMVDRASWRLDLRQSSELAMQTAIAHLRMGEQANCLAGHHPDSCLMPLRGGGVHRDRTGADGAIRVLTRYLEQDPGHLGARWLLNLAFMALGQYPNGVPEPYRIPPRVFESEADLGRFPDVAGSLGVDVDDLAGGVIAEDFDGDGHLDLMVSSSRMDGALRLFRNRGDGRFEERTDEAGLGGLTGGLNLMQTDFDNDGRKDVWVLRGGWLGKGGHHPSSLLKNVGNGVFEDVTEAAGLLALHPTQTAVWLDFDGDGWLDVFVGYESRPGDEHVCALYRNQGDGTFRDVAAQVGLAVTGFIKAVAAGDFDNDGRPDVYLSDLEGPNRLFRNRGPEATADGNWGWRFEDVTSTAGVAEPRHSFPAWFWDFDNDGWQDLFVCGYRYRGVGDIAADYLGMENEAERPRLYRNLGNGRFADVTREVGLWKVILAMGSNFGDLDNDGWLDCYLGTGDPDLGTLVPNRMFRNDRGRRFQDVTTSGGFGHLQKGHGVAFADLDNDGDQDVYQVLGGAMEGDHYPNALFLNPGHGNNWIRLEVEGATSNRAGLGVRLKVTCRTADGERFVYRTVGSGGSFGASPLRQEIGLGRASEVSALEVFWPATGKTQRWNAMAINRSYRVREDSPEIEVLPMRTQPFSR